MHRRAVIKFCSICFKENWWSNDLRPIHLVHRKMARRHEKCDNLIQGSREAIKMSSITWPLNWLVRNNVIKGRIKKKLLRFTTWGYSLPPLSVYQFSSVTQSWPTLCDPMDCSTPGFPVHHQLTELAQTHVHWVGDAIQSSHPLSSPSPPASNLSQGLFQWVSFSHQVAKVLEFQSQHQSFQWVLRIDFL